MTTNTNPTIITGDEFVERRRAGTLDPRAVAIADEITGARDDLDRRGLYIDVYRAALAGLTAAAAPVLYCGKLDGHDGEHGDWIEWYSETEGRTLCTATRPEATPLPETVIVTRDSNFGARSEWREHGRFTDRAEARAALAALRAEGGAWRYALGE